MSGKVCIVTGGASGLGRETALALSAAGAVVSIGDRNELEGRAVADELANSGGSAVFLPLDVVRKDSVRDFVHEVVSRFGRLDCAVNNAGVEGHRSVIADYPEEEWEQVIGINLIGVFICMKYELAAMSANGAGSVVNIGSTGSLRGEHAGGRIGVCRHVGRDARPIRTGVDIHSRVSGIEPALTAAAARAAAVALNGDTLASRPAPALALAAPSRSMAGWTDFAF